MGGARQGRRERSYWFKYGRDRGRRLAAIQRGPEAQPMSRQALLERRALDRAAAHRDDLERHLELHELGVAGEPALGSAA